jgi:phage recombination protein Bet
MVLAEKGGFTPDQIQLLQTTICRGSTSDEFQLFIHACKKTGLDPFMRQIYAVKRWDSGLKREAMAIQVGIDGFRAIADKSGHYAPGKETVYSYDKDGQILSATAYVKKQTRDGTWHEIGATAFYSEYVAKNKDGNATNMWASKSHIMLGKCAEALALRKSFPYELSGIYAPEELGDSDASIKNKIVDVQPVIDEERIESFIKDTGLIKEDVEKYITYICKERTMSREEVFAKVMQDSVNFVNTFKLWDEKYN